MLMTAITSASPIRPGLFIIVRSLIAPLLVYHCDDGKLQSRFTKEIINTDWQCLPSFFTPARISYAVLNCDPNSSVFLTVLPTEENNCVTMSVSG